MQIAHIIDEVVFDLSFVSTCIVGDHESKVSAWITGQILPTVDSVLNEFDEAKTVLRLDLVEVDLGDVTEETFQAVLAQRLREILGSMLHGIHDNSAPSNASADNPSRVSYAQIDLERLQFFLTTGLMASHANTSSRQFHEQILERVLQENSDTFIRFLQESTVKRTLIDRLVKQFTEPHLVNLLQKITPNHVALILNLLEVYRVTITGKQFSSTTSVASINALWVSVFDVVLDQSFASKDQVTVTSAVVEKLMALSTSDSAGILKKMQRIATRLKLEKKIDAALPKLLTDVRERRHGVVKAKNGRKIGSRLQKKVQKKESAAQYQRIIQALKAVEIAEFRPLLKGLQKHSAKIRERLATQGKRAVVREQLAEKLTDEILLDITGLFIPTAVGYIKQLLAQTSRLHQSAGEEAWKQLLWKSHLSYLFVESHTAFVPTDYLKTVASLMSPTHDAESVLRIWCAELSTTTNMPSTEQSLPNLLLQLVVDDDRSMLQEIEQHASDSDAYKTLIQRLQSDVPHDTQSLQPVIVELSQEYPEQWQRIHEAIRDGILSTAHLSVLEQQQLLIAFIDQAPVFNAENRAIFIQAVTSHAKGAADPSEYYQQVLQALLHDKPVDLEAIQKHGTPDKNNAAEPRLSVDEAKGAVTVDRTQQYQRIVQALEETEIVGFYPLPEGLQQHPVMIRQLLAEHGKQAATRQQLAVRLTDRILLDITDLYVPAAVSYIKQLLAHAAVLHLGEGEIEWKNRLRESHLNYLFTEPNIAFIPADYLKVLARLMSSSNDAQPVLVAWYQLLYAIASDQPAEQILVNLLQRLIIDQPPSSEAFKALVQRLQQGAPQDAQSLQAEIIELAQEYPEQLLCIYDVIRNGALSMARLNVVDQKQILMAYIGQAPAFNAENSATFIQAIESHAADAVDPLTYYQRVLYTLLNDQPVDLVFLSEQSDSSQNFAVCGDESTVTDATAETTDPQPLFDEYAVAASVRDIETIEMIEISNAGQVIAAPYLPRLFQMLKLLDDEGAFLSLDAAERAVYLLQFMVDEQSESPEYMLILNKILCGIPTAIPIRRQMNLSEHEKKVVEDLIQGMIQNWKTIGNTSVSGFRQTFLQRDGGLMLEDDAWRLTVHPGTFDMLLDGLPWSFSIVKHAWMDKPIHVDWR